METFNIKRTGCSLSFHTLSNLCKPWEIWKLNQSFDISNCMIFYSIIGTETKTVKYPNFVYINKKIKPGKSLNKERLAAKLRKLDFFTSRWKMVRVLAGMNAVCLLSFLKKRLNFFIEYYKDTIYDFDYNSFLSILKVSPDSQICQSNKWHIFVRTTNSALWLSLAKLQY